MRCLIFLNGRYDENQMFNTTYSDLLIAADGGVKYLLSHGILPHIFVGDGDSVEKSDLEFLRKKGCQVILYPTEKDEIDAELAIKEALKRNPDEIFIFGWQGDRLDMLLALIYLMGHCSKKIKAISGDLEMGVVKEAETLEARKGEKWSILPICGDALRVSLKGFKYELDEKDLPCSKPFGVSNVAISESVTIKVSQGKVVYFRWKKEPL